MSWNPIEKIKTADKDSVFKWVFVIGAGLMTLIANIFDTRKKDRLYSKKIEETIRDKANAA